MIKIKIGYGVHNVYQRYWYSQWDLLYAVLSRRGNSVDFVTVEINENEKDRLIEVSEEIIKNSIDENEIRVAKHFLRQLEE